jgi:hypothetical protein
VDAFWKDLLCLRNLRCFQYDGKFRLHDWDDEPIYQAVAHLERLEVLAMLDTQCETEMSAERSLRLLPPTLTHFCLSCNKSLAGALARISADPSFLPHLACLNVRQFTRVDLQPLAKQVAANCKARSIAFTQEEGADVYESWSA